ncbi:CHASE3 domain-containing protein [Streptomyces sp. LP05-1]|uniref:histidine kinase n=1 Tax=Streptomyces pyxinae TaxID=2970734 RepID=A0ABT2CBX7_9ACTN|nr:sensor histidine kinase [Streptomyces sp. LP05-1]MCS0634895.1 CHASE3 domain-containing protein [Streptomyces sp. LP05-1]
MPGERPADEEKGPARGRLTVQGWFHVVLGLLVVVVVVAAAVGASMLGRTQDRMNQLVDEIQPARSVSYQIQKAIVDQETGVRGYALTRREEFLEPYRRGLRNERERRAELDELVAGYPRLIRDAEAIDEAADRWRAGYAEPFIKAVRSGGTSGVVTRLNASKQAFDELRVLFDRQVRDTEAARDQARTEYSDARTQRDVALSVVLGAILAAAVLLTMLVHRMVGRPLNRLRAASDRVRSGSFDERIPADGPSDIRAVGRTVEAMRRRVVEELRATRAREELLSRQTDELEAQAAELRRSNSELEQFAYVASHDLQEPLRKVASFCQLLEKRYGEQLDARGKQYIDFAVDGAKRMQVLINDLLTFSRVGRLDQERASVELDTTVDRALRNLATAVQETGAKIGRPAEMPTLTCDPTLLTMVWQNLVGNAIKFRSKDRPCEITIGCERTGAEWSFTVRDNGIGIAPEFADKVFVIFQRLHSREEYEGTGIGLALCRKIVEHHGGHIGLESPPDGGTIVRFTLPAAQDQAGDATAGAVPADA